jgi:hypothetical protein
MINRTYGESEQLSWKYERCVGSLTKHQHLRGSRIVVKDSSTNQGIFLNLERELQQPHTAAATVLRTGDGQPSSCGRKSKAIRESIMSWLPGNSRELAPGIIRRLEGDDFPPPRWPKGANISPAQEVILGLTGKGSYRSFRWQSHRSSPSAGKPRTWRRVAGKDGF